MNDAPLAEQADLDARVLLQLRQLLVDAFALARGQEALQVNHVRLILGQQVLTCIDEGYDRLRSRRSGLGKKARPSRTGLLTPSGRADAGCSVAAARAAPVLVCMDGKSQTTGPSRPLVDFNPPI